MTAVTITQITPFELETLIDNSIKKHLPANKNGEPKKGEIIDREELCKRLNITTPTAIRWAKKGLIPSFAIGSSIRYNWPKVIEALENKKEVRNA
jgi:hypothetical protein